MKSNNYLIEQSRKMD